MIHLTALALAAAISPFPQAQLLGQDAHTLHLDREDALHLTARFDTTHASIELNLTLDQTIPQAVVIAQDEEGVRFVPRTGQHFYSGTMVGHDEARVAAFEVGDDLYAMILDTATGNVTWLEPSQTTGGLYDLRSPGDSMQPDPIGCACGLDHAPHAHGRSAKSFGNAPTVPFGTLASSAPPQLMAVALDSDYELVERVGGTDADVADYMTGALFAAGLVHEAYLGIRPYASAVRIQRRPAGGVVDPNYRYTFPLFTNYNPVVSPYPLLVSINWPLSFPGVINVVQLISGKNDPHYEGLAQLDGACATANAISRTSFAALNAEGRLSRLVAVMTHELGHSLSLNHNLTGEPSVMGVSGGDMTFSPSEKANVDAFLLANSGCMNSTGSVRPAPTITSHSTSVDATSAVLGRDRFAMVSVQGTELQYIHEFEVDGVILYSGNISYVSSTQIELEIPESTFSGLGAKTVLIRSTGGTASFPMVLTAPTVTTQPLIIANAFNSPIDGLDIFLASRPNAQIYVTYNTSGGTVMRGSDLVLSPAAVAGVTSTNGFGNARIPIAASNINVLIGDTVYLQSFGIGPLAQDYDVSAIDSVCFCP